MGKRTSGHWLILDRQATIIAAKTIEGTAEQHLGSCLWDIYPEAKRLYEQTFAVAWAAGHAETLAFHMGRLVRITAGRTRAGIKVSYRVIAELETVPLQALQASLDRIEGHADDALAKARAQDRASHPSVPPAPTELRLLPPGPSRQ
jgi:hypothetical protein